MHDELTARQRAISLRLAGRSVKHICAALGRVEARFYKWWRRYLEAGPPGLYDLTRANHHVAQRIPPELERTILSVRRRLQAHATPATRYSLIGATAILSELKNLGIRPLPSERTIERVLERNGLTAPRVWLAPLLPRQKGPGPQARASNELHEVDLVGPIYLKGRGHRYYIWVVRHEARQWNEGTAPKTGPVPPLLVQAGREPLGRSCRWMQAGGERAAPERYPCGPTQATNRRGLAKRSQGACQRSGFRPTGNGAPVPGWPTWATTLRSHRTRGTANGALGSDRGPPTLGTHPSQGQRLRRDT
jgi:hypothetical protein